MIFIINDYITGMIKVTTNKGEMLIGIREIHRSS